MGVKFVDDDDDVRQELVISLGPATAATEPEYTDPFTVSGKDINKIQGLAPTIKRKTSRMLKGILPMPIDPSHGMNGAESKAVDIDYFTAYDAFQVVQPKINLDYFAKAYEINASHYAACNSKTSNIVGLGFTLKESQATLDKLSNAKSAAEKKKINKKLAGIKASLLEMIDNMNDDDTFVEVLEKVWTDYEATGNGYIEVGRTSTGKIGYIGHVPSVTMRVRRGRDGFIQLVGNIATFFRNFADTETSDPIGTQEQPNEIIHIKKYTPTGTFYGVPDVLPALNALAGDEFAQRFNLDYFENKAIPRYLIISKGLEVGQKQQKAMHEFFLTNLKGKNHRTLYIPLPADTVESKVDFKIEAIEAGIQDSSFSSYRTANRDEILMAHRVPLSKVSVSENVQLAAAISADQGFKSQVCGPEQDKLEKRLNKIMKEFTDIFVISLNEMTLTDENTQSQIAERRIRNKITVPNEERAVFGLPPMEGGDEVVELKPQQAAEANAQTGATRARDAERSANATDNSGGTTGRNPKGSGRNTP